MMNRLRMTLLSFTAAILAGCSRAEEFTGSDNKILCNPTTGEAFFSRPGVGDTTFVTRAINADNLCPQPPKTEAGE